MEFITLFSPSSYPTLSRQVGKETEIACGVCGGTASPKVTLIVQRRWSYNKKKEKRMSSAEFDKDIYIIKIGRR